MKLLQNIGQKINWNFTPLPAGESEVVSIAELRKISGQMERLNFDCCGVHGKPGDKFYNGVRGTDQVLFFDWDILTAYSKDNKNILRLRVPCSQAYHGDDINLEQSVYMRSITQTENVDTETIITKYFYGAIFPSMRIDFMCFSNGAGETLGSLYHHPVILGVDKVINNFTIDVIVDQDCTNYNSPCYSNPFDYSSSPQKDINGNIIYNVDRRPHMIVRTYWPKQDWTSAAYPLYGKNPDRCMHSQRDYYGYIDKFNDNLQGIYIYSDQDAANDENVKKCFFCELRCQTVLDHWDIKQTQNRTEYTAVYKLDRPTKLAEFKGELGCNKACSHYSAPTKFGSESQNKICENTPDVIISPSEINSNTEGTETYYTPVELGKFYKTMIQAGAGTQKMVITATTSPGANGTTEYFYTKGEYPSLMSQHMGLLSHKMEISGGGDYKIIYHTSPIDERTVFKPFINILQDEVEVTDPETGLQKIILKKRCEFEQRNWSWTPPNWSDLRAGYRQQGLECANDGKGAHRYIDVKDIYDMDNRTIFERCARKGYQKASTRQIHHIDHTYNSNGEPITVVVLNHQYKCWQTNDGGDTMTERWVYGGGGDGFALSDKYQMHALTDQCTIDASWGDSSAKARVQHMDSAKIEFTNDNNIKLVDFTYAYIDDAMPCALPGDLAKAGHEDSDWDRMLVSDLYRQELKTLLHLSDAFSIAGHMPLPENYRPTFVTFFYGLILDEDISDISKIYKGFKI